MPTVLRVNGYRCFFYSNEGNEPVHVHIAKGNGEAKVWMEPSIELVYFHGFSSKEVSECMEIANQNRLIIIQKWHEFFR